MKIKYLVMPFVTVLCLSISTQASAEIYSGNENTEIEIISNPKCHIDLLPVIEAEIDTRLPSQENAWKSWAHEEVDAAIIEQHEDSLLGLN